MSKSSSKKRIIIAASLFAIFLIGAIVSVVLVLAATTQNVQTNISIAYIVDGVGAKVKSSYAIVPIKEDETITRVSMTSNGNEDLNFGVSEQQSTAEMQPASGLYLDIKHQQIVFEYYFESTSDAAFSIELIDSPGKNSGTNTKEQTSNMLETFCVSNTRLDVAEYRNKITEEKLKPQALTELGQHVFIYVSAKVKNENLNAYYNGLFTWKLNKQDTITVTLNNGGTKGELKVIPSSVVAGIAMPPVAPPETTLSQMFMGWNTAADGSGITYINREGTTPIDVVANIGAGTTLYAQIIDAFVVDESGILTSLTTEGQAEEVLYIPKGITAIGDGTNAVSTTAKTVVVPSSVTEIAANAFSGNTTIEYVDFETPVQNLEYADSTGITTIGQKAFYNCTNLKEIIIPDTVTVIGNSAFECCYSLSSIKIGENSQITSIGSWSFYGGCITEINIPSTIEHIGASAFYEIYQLQKVNIQSIESWLNINFGSWDANPLSNGGSLYINGNKIREIEISTTATEIKQYSFYNYSDLVSVTIPINVTSIGEDAFDGCSGLKDIYYQGPERMWNKIEGVSNIPSNCQVHFDESVVVTSPLSYFEISEDGTTITGLSAEASEIENLELVIGGNGITTIGESAFSSNSNIISVELLDGVTSIGNYAFYYCSSLTSITIPNSVTNIGDYAFYYCSSLTSITIPSSITNIGNYAFSSCDNLTYNLYDDAKYLGNDENPYVVLMGLTSDSITSFEVKKETRIISDDVFGYTIIESITFEEDSQLKSVGSGAFSGCPITEIFLPEGLLRLGDYVFYETYNLNVISLPSTLNYLGEDVFGYMGGGNIEKLYIKNIEQLFELQINIGYNYYGAELIYVDNVLLTEVVVPNTITKIPYSALHNCNSITSITIPSSVTSIEGCAFQNCSSLTSVTFEEGSKLTNIESSAFYGCSNLSRVNIPSIDSWLNITFAGSFSSPLYNGGSLYINNIEQTEIEIPNTITKINNFAFAYCSSLTSIIIPDSVTSIGDSAFYGCSKLTTVTFAENSQLTSIGSDAFKSCSGLTSITIPSSVTSIGSSAFYGCSSLTSIIIPSSVTSIGSSAFYGCSGLTSITISSSVTSIGDSAFSGCSSLTSITIPSSVTSIGSYAFSGCSKLTTVTFAENSQLTSIGRYAFSSCSGLTSITIPSSVTSIGSYAFSSCSSLTSVTFNNKSGWKIYNSTSSTATGYEINVETPATNATNLKNTSYSSTINSSSINWGYRYLICS